MKYLFFFLNFMWCLWMCFICLIEVFGIVVLENLVFGIEVLLLGFDDLDVCVVYWYCLYEGNSYLFVRRCVFGGFLWFVVSYGFLYLSVED